MSEEEKDTTNSDESSSVFGKVRERFQDGILDLSEEFDELTMVVRKDSIYDILEFLKTDTEHSYDFLVDVTAVDYSQMEECADEIRFCAIHGGLSPLLVQIGRPHAY